jgi:HAD superfamily hydrolase (TIGR01509 family)
MPPITSPAAVLWDLDGTLIDSEAYWMKSERELALEHGFDWQIQDGLEMVGQSLSVSGLQMKQKFSSHLEVPEIIERLTSGVMDQLANRIPWRPGALDLLLELRSSGIKTALVTMSMSRMAQALADSIGFDAFDVVVAGDQVTNGKPHPEPYLRAAELLGVDPSHCVAFEDSLTGLIAAESAGTKAIGIPNVMAIPDAPGRIIWNTLQGVKLADLTALFS